MVLPVRPRAMIVMTVMIVTIAMFIVRTPVVIAPVIVRFPPVLVAPAAAIPVVSVIIPIANLQFYRRDEGDLSCLHRHGSDQHQ
jgi:hypothetical protein